jgi:hypothetical protein
MSHDVRDREEMMMMMVVVLWTSIRKARDEALPELVYAGSILCGQSSVMLGLAHDGL